MKGKVTGKPNFFYIYLGIKGGEKGPRFFCQIVDTDDKFKILHDFEVKIKDIDDNQGIIVGLDKLLKDFKFDERFVIVVHGNNVEWENGRRRNTDGSIDTICLSAGGFVTKLLLSYFPIDHDWNKPEYEVIPRSEEYRGEGTITLRKKNKIPVKDELLF